MSQKKTKEDKQKETLIENELQTLKNQLEEAREREKRSLADYQNLQRRTQQERSQIVRFANKDLIKSLLPILENLEKLSIQIEDKAFTITLKDFKQILQQAGLEEIKALGKKFNLETMEAANKKGEGDQVTEVLRKGYRLKEDVIQHAKVVLGKDDEE